MMDFWIVASLLLLAALAVLLLPLLRGRKAQTEEDRTALNVALYQERLAELQAQQTVGVLSAEQLTQGQAEAARELLADTDGCETERRAPLAKWLPLAAAVMVPLLGLGLYLQWGASEQVELTRQFAQAPRSVEEMTARLEQAVQLQPESAEAWYFLGRTYMAQTRPQDAATAFEKAVNLAGRQPELLGQWAQALYFVADKKWSAQLQTLTDEALKADPQEATSLGLLGIAAFEAGRFKDAVLYWRRLVAALPADDPSRAPLEGGIARALEQMTAAGESLPAVPVVAAATGATLKVRVSLADELKGKVLPGDSVFIFAKASAGPPMPLAVKRLTVADLPAEVSLSDSDAMMPQLKLSNFPQVQLQARISRAGNAKAGEWMVRSQSLSSSSSELQLLVISSADQ
ncbi:MAG: c-type cytochrome biogenesis protein CcmI [Pseudomonas sp.]|uniref:c-type cytochrome biogenesis protein CcmI n=1 Tax=Pseudomonas sp. TaxID=306 RepID=UPI0027375276|nr:c-type cytochrome biogenesis protein CcmI [Pseudomonas sp.]MDP3845966.1 c-type cytochrome biogenesis protein CcmI [Pseudomonas sp.]